MDELKFEIYLAKAISKTKTSKKPLLVLIVDEKDKPSEWINKWIDKENIERIENLNAAIVLKITHGNNANFQFFKNYIKNMHNYDSDEHDKYLTKEQKECLFIINANNIQEVISDISDKEECNSILSMFISPYQEAKKEPIFKITIQDKTEDKENKPIIKKEAKNVIKKETTVDKSKNISSAHAESERKYRQKLLKLQREEREERKRIKQLIEQDKLEKKDRFQFGSTSIEGEVIENEEIKDHIHNKQKFNQITDCKLSIKTIDNKNIIHTFKSDDSLDTVRKYLVEVEKVEDNFMFHRNVPRLTYKDIDEFKSLKDLDLLPRSALILEPKHNPSNISHKSPFFEAKNDSNHNRTFIDMVYNWWNGNTAAHENEEEEEEEEETTIIDDTKKDSRETYNGNTTNVIDPKDSKKD